MVVLNPLSGARAFCVWILKRGGCDGPGKSAAERSYPASEVGTAARTNYPVSEVRGGREELPHAPTPEARGGGREEQPHA